MIEACCSQLLLPLTTTCRAKTSDRLNIDKYEQRLASSRSERRLACGSGGGAAGCLASAARAPVSPTLTCFQLLAGLLASILILLLAKRP